MYILYDFIFFLIALVYLPAYIFKGKLHGGLKARLGILPKQLNLGRPLWIHAVSVGEAVMIKGFLEELRKKFPQKNVVITTVTPTGNAIARTLAREGDLVTYLPFDISFIVAHFIRIVRPCMCVIAETELWPNLLRSLRTQHIPVALVNGLILDRSFPRYYRFRWFCKHLFNNVGFFCVQSQTDKSRLMQIGVDEQHIAVTGNMKFDAVSERVSVTGLRRKLALSDDDRLFVCASTHHGEDAVLIAAFKDLVMESSSVRFCIAPRHPERTGEIEKLLLDEGFEPVRISRLSDTPALSSQGVVFILDTVGVLMEYYALADIVFVGGSLVKKGGHNILEPASLAKPVMTGPHLFNFRDIADLFIRNNACVIVENSRDIVNTVAELLRDPARRKALGEAGLAVVRLNQGATQRTLALVHDLARQYGI